jgi:hypothetical protein
VHEEYNFKLVDMKRIVLALMTFASLISAHYVRAGWPTSDEDHVSPWAMNVSDQTEFYAVGTGYTNSATQAFNFLQDTRGKPHVKKVEFNWDTDRFFWTGPLIGDICRCQCANSKRTLSRLGKQHSNESPLAPFRLHARDIVKCCVRERSAYPG